MQIKWFLRATMFNSGKQDKYIAKEHRDCSSLVSSSMKAKKRCVIVFVYIKLIFNISITHLETVP